MIPVYINNFNRLTYVLQLLKDFGRFNEVTPLYVHLVDNGSTYQPLLDWYNSDKNLTYGYPIKIHRCANGGPRGYYQIMSHTCPLYVVCDPDISLIDCPADTLELMKRGIVDTRYRKVGLGIRVDDIPVDGPFYKQILDVENRYRKINDGTWWQAEIDTTFFLARTGSGFDYGPALRSMAPYELRHLPYYYLPGQLTEEELYYFDNLPSTHKTGLYWSTMMQDAKTFDRKSN